MKILSGLILTFVAVATLASDVRACADIKIFLGSCEMKSFGTRITRQAALDIHSPFVKREGLLELTNQALDFFEFALEDFSGMCQLPNFAACNLLNCGCIPGFESGTFRPGRKLNVCFPVFGCQVRLAASSPAGNGLEETMLGICVGGHCKAFLLVMAELYGARNELCGPPRDKGCVTNPPICVDEVAACCLSKSQFCFCKTCDSQFLHRKELSLGRVVFEKVLKGKTKCICPGP